MTTIAEPQITIAEPQITNEEMRLEFDAGNDSIWCCPGCGVCIGRRETGGWCLNHGRTELYLLTTKYEQ